MKDLDQFTVYREGQFGEVAALIDSNAAKIAIVLDGSGTVVGTISDGGLSVGCWTVCLSKRPQARFLNTSFSFC